MPPFTLIPIVLLAALLQAACSAEPSPLGGADDAAVDRPSDSDLDTDEPGETTLDGNDLHPDLEPGCTDRDGDGRGDGCSLGFDCNDGNPAIHEGAVELCDRLDNDCNQVVDEGCPCENGSVQSCYTGPDGTQGVGTCRAGWQSCSNSVWGFCESQVVPQEERCDSVDNDCNGQVDEGLTNACGLCGRVAQERCGDILDNDCDGAIDETDAGCDCQGRTNQPCYGGPPQTLGVGVCRGGVADCATDGYGSCRGQIRPTLESCDGLDNDCDGLTDENLANRCGLCGQPDAREICDGVDNDCDGLTDEGLVLACGRCSPFGLTETCGNGLDDDCDGQVDDGCSCLDGDTGCYPGSPHTRQVGACRDGARTCDRNGEFWSDCEGFALPEPEICDGEDNDCDGSTDLSPLGCLLCQTALELCDGEDNDCDGQTDEYLRNSCGDCRSGIESEELCGPACCNEVDDDCDGLVDEGLVNACGRCGETCYHQRWSTLDANLDEGEANGLDEDLTSGLRLGTQPYQYPYLWVANSGEATVSKINTRTFELEATYPVGPDPSRTAVDLDGNVWVVNRAFTTAGGTLRRGSVTKVEAENCEGFDCVRFTRTIGDPGDIPTAVAVDDTNHPWVGTYEGRDIYRLDPDNGTVLDSFPVGMRVYGMAIDAERIVWIANLESPNLGEGALAAFDVDERRMVPGSPWMIPDCSNPYGIALDAEGHVWLGNYTCDNVVEFDPGTRTFATHVPDPNGLDRVRGIAVDGSSVVWTVASESDVLGRLVADDGSFELIDTCDGPMGVGVASSSTIWVPCWNSQVWYYDLAGTYLGSVTAGLNPFSYSDMTGFQLTNFVLRTGSWTVVFDCGGEDCQFDLMSFDASTPAGTRIALKASTSLDGSSWSDDLGPFEVSPASLAGLTGGRFLKVTVFLHTTDRTASPTISRVEVGWQRP